MQECMGAITAEFFKLKEITSRLQNERDSLWVSCEYMRQNLDSARIEALKAGSGKEAESVPPVTVGEEYLVIQRLEGEIQKLKEDHAKEIRRYQRALENAGNASRSLRYRYIQSVCYKLLSAVT
jgi:hypothetical protein